MLTFIQIRDGLAKEYEGEKSGRESWWRTYMRVNVLDLVHLYQMNDYNINFYTQLNRIFVIL